MGIVGGSKVSTKLDLLHNLIIKLDQLAIGGGMANTFLYAQGWEVGASYCEKELADTARGIMAFAEARHCELLAAASTSWSPSRPEPGAAARVRELGEIDPHERILDAGPKTVERLCTAMDAASTLIWNGPLGVFEVPPFDRGTVAAARHAAELAKAGKLVAVAGGGDTVSALNAAGVAGDFTFVSTAGGAFLEWMEGKTPARRRGAESGQRRNEGRASMDLQALHEIAERMTAPGKGLLAADESTGTIKKRFDAIGLESTETSRRDYREMLFRADDAMRNYVSGVILYEETLYQNAADANATPLVDADRAQRRGAGHQGRQGHGAAARLPGRDASPRAWTASARGSTKDRERGARFAKWRAMIDIGEGIPTWGAVKANAHALARYAAICQAHDIVPIVEPEVLMDGAHAIDALRGGHPLRAEDRVPGALRAARGAGGHGAEAEHGRARRGERRAGVGRGSGRAHAARC